MVSVPLNIMCSSMWGRPVLPLGASCAPTGCIKAKEMTGTPGLSTRRTRSPFLRTFSTTGRDKADWSVDLSCPLAAETQVNRMKRDRMILRDFGNFMFTPEDESGG